MKRLIHIFRRKKTEEIVLSPEQYSTAVNQAYLEGHSDGLQVVNIRAKDAFDQGFTEGYNEGRTAGLREAKAAALKSLGENK